MKKQDKESLIREVTKRLDWYTMEASDEEFDADEVQTLLKLLDSLKGEEKEEELPVEEALDSFWKYCEKRQEEERILAADRKESAENRKTKPEKKEGRMSQFLWYFHKHRIAVVTAVALIVIMLGGSWQMAVNAEKHGGFFWWMDKNEEGITLITAPEGGKMESEYRIVGKYSDIQDIPNPYQKYAMSIFNIETLDGYHLKEFEVVKSIDSDTVYEILQNENMERICFWIKIYPEQILRVRESYPGYSFLDNFEDDEIEFDIFMKDELKTENSYIIIFYYGKEKYIIGGNDKDSLKELALEYKSVVVDNYVEK